MLRVNKSRLCPICQHDTWCGISEDGCTAICMRVESDKKTKNGGFLHILHERTTPLPPVKRHKPKPETNIDFLSLHKTYTAACRNADALAAKLGVSEDSLRLLEIGWDGKNWTFPMRNAAMRIVGIKKRSPEGKKFCVTGSHLGVYMPVTALKSLGACLVVTEGESDTAALLDLKFDAIGRPSCSGGVEIIQNLLKKVKRQVVIMADKDEPKKTPDGREFNPGLDGAHRLAEAIKPLCDGVKIIKPLIGKDIRAWYRAGATTEAVLAVAKNARFV